MIIFRRRLPAASLPSCLPPARCRTNSQLYRLEEELRAYKQRATSLLRKKDEELEVTS